MSGILVRDNMAFIFPLMYYKTVQGLKERRKSVMEYMKEKKPRVAIYCRVGNPADAGIAVERTSGYDNIWEGITLAGQKAMEEVFAVGYSYHNRSMSDMPFLKRRFAGDHC